MNLTASKPPAFARKLILAIGELHRPCGCEDSGVTKMGAIDTASRATTFASLQFGAAGSAPVQVRPDGGPLLGIAVA